MNIKIISEQRAFSGTQGVYSHQSKTTQCDMTFSVFTPSLAKQSPCPVLFYLSGLTCNHENATTKSGFQRYAEEAGVFIVCPDTSPRGTNFDGEHDDYDFGSGAGFYLNATQTPWRENYQMYDYVNDELPALIAAEFNILPNKMAIFGHSMGGHGALTIGLKNPDKFRSISAFSPIVNPSKAPWGIKAFTGYLGDSKEAWRAYDATNLMETGLKSDNEILIDQGLDDEFLNQQLMPEKFEKACKQHQQALKLRRHPGYDHSYYFIASFIEDHIRFHRENLG